MARISLPDGDGPDVTRALTLRPQYAEAVATWERAVGRSQLDWRLHELVRMRVAQINECTLCLSWRNKPAFDAGVTEELLANVGRYREHDGFTDRERLAVEYAERYCTESARIDDAFMDRLRSQFDDGEIVDLTLVVAKYLSMGRFMQVLGLDQTCDIAFDDTGTLVKGG